MNYVDELISRYMEGEISGDDVCDNITRITKKEEYINDVNENRKKEKLTNRYAFLKYGKSPEDILIKWEEDEQVVQFLNFIKTFLTPKEWYMFVTYTLGNVTSRQLGHLVHMSENSVRDKMVRIRRKIRDKIVPAYNEQFGDIREYLRR